MRFSPRVVAAFAALVFAALVSGLPARAQMPDAAQMSGLPLPSAELPNGTISVRVVRKEMSNNVVGQAVSVTGGGQTRTGTTDAQGRAEFSGFPVGTTVVATTTVDGELLVSQDLPVPARGGVRVALVAGVASGTATAPTTAPATPTEPLQKGEVTIGGDSRIVVEFQSDVLTVFYLLDIVNNTKAPVDPGAPLDVALPAGAASPALMEGSSTQATVRGESVRVTGPFPPGATSVQIGFSVPDHGGTYTLRQTWPAAFERPFVAVEKVGALQVTSTQLPTTENLNAEGGKAFVLANGPRLAAGTELVVTLTDLPAHSPAPRWVAVGLAAIILTAGFFAAFSRTEASSRAALEAERARLMRELVTIEERRLHGRPKPKDAERRPAIVADLERVLAEIDDTPGGGQGAAA